MANRVYAHGSQILFYRAFTLAPLITYLTHGLGVQDIQRLWLSGREAAFWVRFSEYFKYFEEEDPPEQLDHVFQHALSVDDIDILIDSYEECNNFITHTLTTAEEQREHE